MKGAINVPDFELEARAWDRGFHLIAGVDEAGRGPWAGPVVAGAVILDGGNLPTRLLEGLDDSKKLSARKRDEIFALLPDWAAIGVGLADAPEIDQINILQASFRAMERALAGLHPPPDYVLVDGDKLPSLPCAAEFVVKGDSRSLSIAAASIVAKVTRDRIMSGLAVQFPGYGWERNAGYGTAEHKAALTRLGVTDQHRKSYAPIRKMLSLD